MNYDTMEAGREMDALVAEKVMGFIPQKDFGEWPEHDWKRNKDGSIDTFGMDTDNHNGPSCIRCFYSYCLACPKPEDHGKCVVNPINYSEYIAAAWRIIEKLCACGKIDGAFLSTNRCELYLDREQTSAADGETPLAICRAALKAAGEKEEG